MKKRSPRRVICAAAIASASAAVAGALVMEGAAAGSPNFVVAGAAVPNDTFSFSTLQTPAQQRIVESTRTRLIDDCMRERGFEEHPAEDPTSAAERDYAARYAHARIGDDVASDAPPAATDVPLPDGST